MKYIKLAYFMDHALEVMIDAKKGIPTIVLNETGEVIFVVGCPTGELFEAPPLEEPSSIEVEADAPDGGWFSWFD